MIDNSASRTRPNSKKLFDEDTHPGEIKEYCEEEMFYRVACEDGDAEDLYFIGLEMQ
jgi:hypothetical protein